MWLTAHSLEHGPRAMLRRKAQAGFSMPFRHGTAAASAVIRGRDQQLYPKPSRHKYAVREDFLASSFRWRADLWHRKMQSFFWQSQSRSFV